MSDFHTSNNNATTISKTAKSENIINTEGIPRKIVTGDIRPTQIKEYMPHY